MQLGTAGTAPLHVLNVKSAISPELALRLERSLGIYGGGLASLWSSTQSTCDLRAAECCAKPVLKRANRWCS